VREAAFVRRTAIAVLAATAALAGPASTPAGAGDADATRARALLDLGDSLSVGAAPFLRSRLPGYRVERRHDVGLHAYDAAALIARRSCGARSSGDATGRFASMDTPSNPSARAFRIWSTTGSGGPS